MSSESFEFIKWLIVNYPSLLLLVLGIIVIILDYVKSIKSLKTEVELDPKKGKNLLKIGLALICMGIILSALSYYSQHVTVYGEIKYWDGTPAKFAAIKIKNMEPTNADDHGEFTIKNVSRNTDGLSYRISGLDYIPVHLYISHLDLWKHHITIDIEKPVYTIKGIVYDENNAPLEGAVISIGNMTATSMEGYYFINNACYNPKTGEFCRIKVSNDDILRYSKILQVSPLEYTQPTLIRNINLSSLRNAIVFGEVSYRDEPVKDAQVEIDGKKDVTDANGEYSIKKVSRGTKVWKVTINGNSTEGYIYNQLNIPPHIYYKAIENNIFL
jgi:hypothetical protein